MSVQTSRGTFSVWANNPFIGHPGLRIDQIPGYGTRGFGGFYVDKRKSFLHDGWRYPVTRQAHGSPVDDLTKNFEVVIAPAG